MTFRPTTLVSASGLAPWGTIYAASEKTLTLTGAAGALPAVCELVITGDTDDFEITEYKGEALPSAVSCTDFAADDALRFISMLQGTATTIKVQPRFSDGTEKTLTVTVKDLRGAVMSTIVTSATYADPVRGVIETLGGLLAGYDMSTATDGIRRTADIAVADDVGSADVYGHDSDKYAIVPGAPANCGSSSYISKMLECADGSSTKIGAAASASGCKSRWGIVELDFDSYAGSNWYLGGGTAGVPDLACFIDVDTNTIRLKRDGGTTVLTGSPAPSGTKSYFFGFSYHAGTNRTYFWLCDLSGDWSARQTADVSGDKVPDGICFGTGFGAPSPNGSKWALGSQSTVEYGEADFEDIFDACKA